MKKGRIWTMRAHEVPLWLRIGSPDFTSERHAGDIASSKLSMRACQDENWSPPPRAFASALRRGRHGRGVDRDFEHDATLLRLLLERHQDGQIHLTLRGQ